MKLTPLSNFDYPLPENLIAHVPAKLRDHSRLMVLHKDTGKIEHKKFYQIIDYLKAGDLLVLNDTRVFNATIVGKKEKGTARIEVLLLKNVGKNIWECLLKPGKRLKIGQFISFKRGRMRARVLEKKDSGEAVLEFYSKENIAEVIRQLGKIPLPPYIKPLLSQSKKFKLSKRYQTIYSANLGSSAAPTAGLHFTRPLLRKLKNKGIKIAYVTLHASAGTFRPVFADYIENHKMYSEYFSVPEETAKLIAKTKKNKGRVVAVGTTSARSLEASGGKPMSGETKIFIYPGYKFKVVDAIITNFHFPKSTLLMLVSAFAGSPAFVPQDGTSAGRDQILKAYAEAVKHKYRFFSFGDAMLIT